MSQNIVILDFFSPLKNVKTIVFTFKPFKNVKAVVSMWAIPTEGKLILGCGPNMADPWSKTLQSVTKLLRSPLLALMHTTLSMS